MYAFIFSVLLPSGFDCAFFPTLVEHARTAKRLTLPGKL
jgi:hypothetical protein